MSPPPPSTVRYEKNEDLPSSISEKFSAQQQSAYRNAYNMAWQLFSRDEAMAQGSAADTRAQFAHEQGLKASQPRRAAQPAHKVREQVQVKEVADGHARGTKTPTQSKRVQSLKPVEKPQPRNDSAFIQMVSGKPTKKAVQPPAKKPDSKAEKKPDNTSRQKISPQSKQKAASPAPRQKPIQKPKRRA